MAGESSQKRMGGQKQKWTSEEEEALKDGVKKHGIGKWKNILTDPEFAPSLIHRSNIDLKDKWRNLGISHIVQASKDISPYLAVPCGALPTLQNTNTAQNTISTLAIVDADANASGINGTTIATPVRALQDSIQIPTKRYYSMIYEAISALKDSRGSEFNAIASFIEQRHDVPSNFRRSLSSLVRRLTVQGKLEKVEQRYKIKDTGSRIPAPRHRDGKPGTSKNTESLNPNTLEEAARIAAYRVADADNKSFLAAESIKEAERIATMAEESELMLEVVKGIWERCNL